MRSAFQIILFLLLIATNLHAQYSETFPIANKGILSGPCNGTVGTSCLSNDFSGVNWTIEGNLSGIGAEPFATNASNQLVVSDIDEEACWIGPVLNITGASASFELDLSWLSYEDYNASGVGSKDFIAVQYRIDGGSWVELPNAVGGGPRTVSYVGNSAGEDGSLTNFGTSGLMGSTLQIRVCTDNNSIGETTTISNISATNADVGGTPPTCDLVVSGITKMDEQCPDASDGSISIVATTSNGPIEYSISGPVNQTNSTGIFSDLPDGTYNIVVHDKAFSPGSCDLTDSRTIMAGVDNKSPTASNPATLNLTCQSQIPSVDPAVVTDESDNCIVPCTTFPWINEFHYDNDGVDVGEFIEIAGPAGLNLSAFTIYTYDGSDRMVDQTIPLSGSIDNEENGFGAISFSIPNLQNQMEGIALVMNSGSVVVEFLSYEGSFIAVDGPAFGLTSLDIGVAEPQSQAVNESLSRIGSGNTGSEFSFADQTATPGSKNGSQTFVACPENEPTVSFHGETSSGIGNAASPLVITRTYRVTDAAGNFTDVFHTINVSDNVAPSISCQGNIQVSVDAGQCSAVVNYSVPTSSDNCGVPSLLRTAGLASGSAFPIGTTTVTYQAEDAVGNANVCSFAVTVNEDEPPVIATCLPDEENLPCGTIIATPGGVDGVLFESLGGVVSDNCSEDAAINLTYEDGWTGTVCEGLVLTRTWTATDAAGLTSQSCDQTFSILPPEEAILTAPDLGSGLSCSQAFDFTAPTLDYSNSAGTQECVISGQVIPQIVNDFDKCNGGTITVNYSTTDACGRTVDLSPIILNVSPASAPTIGEASLPEFLGCSEADAFDELAAGVVMYSNNEEGPCLISGELDPMIVRDYDASGGKIYVTYSGTTDCSILLTTITYEIIIMDATAPDIQCPQVTDLSLANGCEISLPDLTDDLVASDNCTATEDIVILQEPAAGTMIGPGTTTVTLTAMDEAGNMSSCTTQVMVLAGTALIDELVCPSDLSYTADCMTNAAMVNLSIPTLPNICVATSIRYRHRPVNASNVPTGPFSPYISSTISNTSFPVGRYEIEWEISDQFGTVNCHYYLQVNAVVPQAPNVSGPTSLCENLTGIPYSAGMQAGIDSYQWTYNGNGITIHDNGSKDITIDFSNSATSGQLSVVAIDNCGNPSPAAVIDIEVGAYLTCIYVNCLNDDLVVTNATLNFPGTPQIFKVGKQITSDATIPMDETIVFKAGEAVQLNSGFQVSSGAIFLAEIEDCLVVFPTNKK
ncbi:MAG: HYR domain-containing protein [Saprospiraceae bacterium]|nr:HYR domain-containing protein [Saprospiraceae bacterium]